MPVVDVVKLHMNTIVIVEVLSKEQVRFVDQFEVVVGQVVDIVHDHNLYQLAYVQCAEHSYIYIHVASSNACTHTFVTSQYLI